MAQYHQPHPHHIQFIHNHQAHPAHQLLLLPSQQAHAPQPEANQVHTHQTQGVHQFQLNHQFAHLQAASPPSPPHHHKAVTHIAELSPHFSQLQLQPHAHQHLPPIQKVPQHPTIIQLVSDGTTAIHFIIHQPPPHHQVKDVGHQYQAPPPPHHQRIK